MSAGTPGAEEAPMIVEIRSAPAAIAAVYAPILHANRPVAYMFEAAPYIGFYHSYFFTVYQNRN